jgi:hypothetical protein
MKVKTMVKAGDVNGQLGYAPPYPPPPPPSDRCWGAFNALMQRPGDGTSQQNFCNCCANDPMCLR